MTLSLASNLRSTGDCSETGTWCFKVDFCQKTIVQENNSKTLARLITGRILQVQPGLYYSVLKQTAASAALHSER